MRAAPALEARLDDARLERVLIVMLHVLAGLVWVAWGLLQSSPSMGWIGELALYGGVGLGSAGLGVLLARRALPVPAGRLCWTGQQWILRLQADQTLHRVQVAIDLGSWLLLRLIPTVNSAPRWRIARQTHAGPDWHALRVALQAHAGAAAVDVDADRGALP